MTTEQSRAFETAKEISVAIATSNNAVVTSEDGPIIADFFETVYKKVMELLSRTNQQ